MRRTYFSAVLIVSVAQLSLSGLTMQRLAPPPEAKCPHDRLTVYQGRAQSLATTEDRQHVQLTIATDWDTVEKVTLPADPRKRSELYLFEGKPFTREDTDTIFVREGELRPGTRVHAWVCSDTAIPPLIDWQRPPQKPRY